MAKMKLRKINKYSISKLLRDQNRSNDFFELMIGNISMEELIALKLEIAFRSVPTPIFGLPIWTAMPKIARDAVMKFAFAAGGSRRRAIRILGLNELEFSKFLSKLKTRQYYLDNNITLKEKKGDVTTN